MKTKKHGLKWKMTQQPCNIGKDHSVSVTAEWLFVSESWILCVISVPKSLVPSLRCKLQFIRGKLRYSICAQRPTPFLFLHIYMGWIWWKGKQISKLIQIKYSWSKVCAAGHSFMQQIVLITFPPSSWISIFWYHVRACLYVWCCCAYRWMSQGITSGYF